MTTHDAALLANPEEDDNSCCAQYPAFVNNILEHRISGSALRWLLRSLSVQPARKSIALAVRHSLGLHTLSKLGRDSRKGLPVTIVPEAARDHARPSKVELPIPASGSWPRTQAYVTELYRRASHTPEQVAKALFRELRDLQRESPNANPFVSLDEATVLADARASTERWMQGAALGPFDGVPIGIKEQCDVAHLRTKIGTNWIRTSPATADATAVRRLREQGALIVGHTVMTEFGMSSLGINPQRRMPTNAHHARHMAGGSSTGSATAVALGLCPVALAADGGGSIRIPAALNGVFGIKPTFGRVPRSGDVLRGSMGHLGPIGASSVDLALFLEAVSGDDHGDPACRGVQPYEPGSLLRQARAGVAGLVVGIDDALWEQADQEIQLAAHRALKALQEEGATVVSVHLKMAEHAAAIGYVTLASEASSMFRLLDIESEDEFGVDVRLMRALVDIFDGDTYLAAQQLRENLRAEMKHIFSQIDVLALPTTASVAPRINSMDEMESGVLDPAALDALCRYSFLANLTGLPAGTAPVGRNAEGLPIGIQFIADAWDESSVLQAMMSLEHAGAAKFDKPARCM